MPSRLSSLLVRDGLVAVNGMARAFENQVLYGGALDTVLLEMDLVGEEQLHKYLSLATGLPPARRDDVDGCASEAAERCSQELSDKYRVVPSSLDNGALKVLVCEPADLASLEGLADEIGVAVQPLIVPEYRLRVAFHAVFGGDVEERFTRLAERAAANPIPDVQSAVEQPVVVSHVAAAPVEIHPEVTEPQVPDEGRLRGKRPDPEQPERRMTMELSTDALREHVKATEALAAGAPKIVVSDVVRTDAASAGSDRHAEQADAAPAGDPLEDLAPLRAAEAREALMVPASRDHIFHILLRSLRSRMRFAGLLTVQGDAAVGRSALTDDGADRDQFTRVSLSLAADSPFKQVAGGQQPFFVGPLPEPHVSLLAPLEQIGAGSVPATLLILPVAIRNRVVAIAVGHCYQDEFTIADVSEILPLSGATADSVSRLIMKAKAVGYRATEPGQQAAAPVSEGEMPDAVGRDTAKGWSVAVSSGAAAVDPSQLGGTSAAQGPPIAELFETIDGGDKDAAEEAIELALGRPADLLAHLETAFPGQSTSLPSDSGGQTPRAEACGPVLDLVVRLGSAAGEVLAEKMRDNDRDVRYFATLCASQIRPSNALNQLVERLFDGDQKIRALAVEGLGGYPAAELHQALEFARRALHSEDTERLKAAAEGLAQVGDIASIADLLDVHSRGGSAADAARRALVQLTKHDFGGSNRKWRGWWNKNQDKNRIEWMLDSLNHKDSDIRKSAVEGLREITGEYFGYGHDLPKKEREQARQRWLEWWKESGRTRFATSGATRTAPTRGDAQPRP